MNRIDVFVNALKGQQFNLESTVSYPSLRNDADVGLDTELFVTLLKLFIDGYGIKIASATRDDGETDTIISARHLTPLRAGRERGEGERSEFPVRVNNSLGFLAMGLLWGLWRLDEVEV